MLILSLFKCTQCFKMLLLSLLKCTRCFEMLRLSLFKCTRCFEMSSLWLKRRKGFWKGRLDYVGAEHKSLCCKTPNIFNKRKYVRNMLQICYTRAFVAKHIFSTKRNITHIFNKHKNTYFQQKKEIFAQQHVWERNIIYAQYNMVLSCIMALPYVMELSHVMV